MGDQKGDDHKHEANMSDANRGFLLPAGQECSSREHDSFHHLRTIERQDERMQEVLSRQSVDELSSNARGHDGNFHSTLRDSTDTIRASSRTAIADDNIRSRSHQFKPSFSATSSTVQRSQYIPVVRPQRMREQERDNHDPVTYPMSRSRFNLQRMRDDDSDKNEAHHHKGNERVFATTEEEESFLEDLQRVIGPRSRLLDEEMPEDPAEANGHGNGLQPRNPVSQLTRDAIMTDQSEAEASLTIPHNLNPQTPSHVQDVPQSSALSGPQSPLPPQLAAQNQNPPHQALPLTYPSTSPKEYPTPAAVAAATPQAVTNTTSASCSDDSSVQDLLANISAIDLSEPRLTNRCRGYEYVPGRTREEMNQRRDEHIKRLQLLVNRLRTAITGRLGITQENDSRVAHVGRLLYHRAAEKLQPLLPSMESYLQGLKGLNLQGQQLAILNHLLRRIDLKIRPNGPLHLQTSLDAWYIAALKWQREIHEDWIAELESNKKRKRGGDGDSNAQGHDDETDDDNGGDGNEGGDNKKARKGTAAHNGQTKQPRRPGRPPGSLNKTTIAAQLRKLSKNSEQKNQKTSLPPLSSSDVQLAQASAARFAEQSTRSGSGVQSYSPIVQTHAQHQQLQQDQQSQQRYSQSRSSVPPPVYPHHGATLFKTSSILPNISSPIQSQEARFPQLTSPSQQIIRPVSNITPLTALSHPQFRSLNQYQIEDTSQIAIHPSMWQPQRPANQLEPQTQSQTQQHTIDPALTYQHHQPQTRPQPQPQPQFQSQLQQMSQQQLHQNSNPILGIETDTNMATDVHVNVDDLWDESRDLEGERRRSEWEWECEREGY